MKVEFYMSKDYEDEIMEMYDALQDELQIEELLKQHHENNDDDAWHECDDDIG